MKLRNVIETFDVSADSYTGFPYLLDPTAKGEDLGAALSAIYGAMRNVKLSSVAICEQFIDWIEADRGDPLIKAWLTIAAEADCAHISNTYHSACHSREVGLAWINLAWMNNRLVAEGEADLLIGSHAFLLGCCAAFGHDIRHDGRGNVVPVTGPDGVPVKTNVPFRLEAVSADFVGLVLSEAGRPAEEIAAVRTAILLTDTTYGYPVLEAALKPGFDVAAAAAVCPEFTALANPVVVLCAALLRDADLLPSGGLTPWDNDLRTSQLEHEIGVPKGGIGPKGTEFFFGSLMGGRFITRAGQCFQKNLEKLRDLNRLRLADRALTDKELHELADPTAQPPA